MLTSRSDDDDLSQDFFDSSIGPYPVGSSAFSQDSAMATMSAAGPWPNMNPNFGVPPPSGMSDIVNSRSNRVDQHFGQITPPEDRFEKMSSQSGKMQLAPQSYEEDAGKLSREQRARNAANTRHSKTKKVRKASERSSASDENEEDGDKPNKSLTVQREKNRVAAAKCRAKKKAGNENKEAEAREICAQHNYLTRELRDLKNEATSLKSQLLSHRPGLCECHGIHHYNAMQAQKLVFEAGGQHQHQHSISSPSEASVQSSYSNGSNAPGRPYSNPRSTDGQHGGSSRQQSISGPSMNQNFGRSDMMPSPHMAAQGRQHMSHEFADFLHSSPGGRAGFA